MFKTILETLKNIFHAPTTYSSLEAYIVAGNPQDIHDIDRLEREFYRRQSNNMGSYNYFHE
jgi:hypothetical protein